MKYKKIGMVIAMEEEAKPIIEGLGFEKEENSKGFKIFTAPSLTLIISGIGIVNATMAADILAIRYECDTILNFGTCGATGKRFKPCDIVSVDRVFKRDVNLTIAGFKKYEIPGNGVEIDLIGDKAFPVCDCYSSDEFVGKDSDVPKDIIVEMEAYPIAFVCKKYGIPCSIYKVVSDLTDTNEDDSEHTKNLEESSKILAEYIIKLVKDLRD